MMSSADYETEMKGYKNGIVTGYHQAKVDIIDIIFRSARITQITKQYLQTQIEELKYKDDNND